MTVLNEGQHAGEFIVSEANGSRSREVITVLANEVLKAGQVIAQKTKAAASAQAGDGNTGDGDMGAIVVGAGAKAGDYKLTIIEADTDAGAFIVEDPDGINVGTGTVGVEFVGGGLTFTLADGSTDFVAGDTFTITVAAGSGKWVAFDQDGVDGSEIAAGILFDNCDATGADKTAVAIVRDAEVNGGELVWPDDIEAGEKTAAVDQLAALGIIVR